VLLVHLLALPVRRVWVTRVHLAVALLVQLFHPSGVLTGNLTAGRCVTDGRQLRANARRVALTRRSLSRISGLAVDLIRLGGCTLSLLFSLALVVFLLLACLPLLSDLLEFFGCSLLSVRLHRDMRIQMVERAICFLASIPAAFVHAFDFFVATSGTLVLLGTGDRDERVDLRKRMRILAGTWSSRGRGRARRHGQSPESCKDQAIHVGVPRTAEASPDDRTFAEADGLGIATCRDLAGRTASKDRGRWDSTRRLMDL